MYKATQTPCCYFVNAAILCCFTLHVMQAPSLMPSSRLGFRGGVTNPGGGGPPIPLGPSTAAGLAVFQGPVQPGINPAHALGHSGHYGIAGTGLGFESQDVWQ